MEKSNYNRGGGGAGRGRGGGRGGSGGGRGGSGGRGGNNYQQYHQGQYQTGGGAGSSGGGGNNYQQHNQGQYQSGGYGGRGGRGGGGRSGTQMWTNPPPAQPWGDRPVQGGQGGSGTQMGSNPPPAQSWGYRRVEGGQGGTQRPESSMGQDAGATGGRGAWSGGPPHVAGRRGSRVSAVGGGAGAGAAQRTDPVPDSVTSDMKSLQISDSPSPSRLLATSSENRLMPMKRPDKGGVVAVRSTRLLVNHFPVAFNSQSTILHYNVDVKQEVTLGSRSLKRSIPKSVLNSIREKLFSDSIWEFPLQKTAYDGEKNIFSAVKLPTGSFKVELSDGEDTKSRIYTFTIELVNELQLSKLKDYLAGNLISMPRDILQGMDLVMKENPSRHRISVGRSTYSREFRREDDLGCGIAAFKGFQQSLKPTSQGLALCLDYSVLAFRKRMPVIDFLKEHIWGFGGVNDIIRLKREVLEALKGLKINVTHRVTKQKFTIAGLTDQNTRNLSFTLEDPEGKDPPRQVTLVNYFREKYGKDIMYKDIPCVDVGKNNRKNYVPLEFCILVEGQRYPKENLDKDAALLLKKISLAPPAERMNTILKMVRAEDAPCGGDIVKNFEIGVEKNMTSVIGRVIGPPDLRLATPAGNMEVVKVDERCQWNLTKKSVVEGRPVERWALIDFTSSERYDRLNPENFVRNLRRRCERLGIRMEEPLAFQSTGMHVFNDVNRLRELLQYVIEVVSRKTKVRLQIVVCVMARRHSGYKSLKFVSETQIGVVTQCCLSKLANEGKDQNLANLALKINAKLGGSNVELIERLPRFEGEDPVMFVGADVNHPGALNATCPSIAAVVASINWPAATQYAARVCPQNHRKEKIVNFGAMCLELVNTFAGLNKVKPKKIVVFRDGVSESQLDMVLNEELQDLKMAIYEENYRPTITLVVAQKRHHTRLFLENQGGDVRRNISPGTVVDTKVVHPFEYDFYLCSHYGNLGTSKPTHYYVLYDEHNFTSDELQKLIYQLCFTFARCTKPVSLVPPVYYADLVAYRGRMFQEVLMEMQSPPSASSSATFASSLSSSAASFDDTFYKLHSELQNIMFFI